MKGGKHLENNIMRMVYIPPYAIVHMCTHMNTHEHMGVYQPELQIKKTLSQNNSGNLTLKSTSHFLQVVWHWTSYLLSLSLNFLICVIALIIKLEDRMVVRSFP